MTKIPQSGDSHASLTMTMVSVILRHENRQTKSNCFDFVDLKPKTMSRRDRRRGVRIYMNSHASLTMTNLVILSHKVA